MKKTPLIFISIMSLLLLVLYINYSSEINAYMSSDKSSIQNWFTALGFIATIYGGIIWLFGKESRQQINQKPDLQPDSPHKQGISADALHEKTDIDKSINIDQSNSPYLGLSAFKPEDAHLFFGRQREIQEALAAFDDKQCHWLQIEGNSGAGKSSLVNAGLLPAIERGELIKPETYKHWKIIKPLMPGETPLRRLAEVLKQSFKEALAQRSTLELQKELEDDERALAYMLNDLKENNDTAFVLFVDQFEELFTFAGKQEKLNFDKQLANALQDKDCPLFLISTVRIDFLEGFEQLPRLSELYNRHCKRYLLKTISLEGLEEAITKPAEMAKLDVSEVTTAILQDAQNEVGALPLVENALQVLWQQRQGNKLSGEVYLQKGGLVGLLEEQADALLDAVDKKIPKGKHSALELLLALTRINDEGRHTRRNLTIGEACLIAGGKKADKQRGLQIIDYLTGRTAINEHDKNNGRLRLLTTLGDNEQEQQVSIIHETLIRARGKDKTTGKLVGYWKTLYDYIEKNRDRGFYRDQLARQAETWSLCKGLKRWGKLANWRDVKHYRPLRLDKGTMDERFKCWSQRKAWLQGAGLAMLLVFVVESFSWTVINGMPPSYMLTQQKFRLMHWGLLAEPFNPKLDNLDTDEIEGEMVKIPISGQPFEMGELDAGWREMIQTQNKDKIANLAMSPVEAHIEQAFELSKVEVSYIQYDYYVWQQRKQGNKEVTYPDGAPSGKGRGQKAVAYVSWNDANAYLQWLNDKPENKGYHYRLPSEAEWEYAARAGSNTAYWWGDNDGAKENRANCNGCGSEWDSKTIAPVNSFKANDWGLHNMAGNVWEWTCSEWTEVFDGREAQNRCVAPDEQSGDRVFRGGSWSHLPAWLRSSSRSRYFTDSEDNNVGFRILRISRTN